MSTEELQEIVKTYDTPFLLEQYVYKRSEYTNEAVTVLEQEIKRRAISQSDIDDFAKKSLIGDVGLAGNVEVQHFKKDDFIKLDGAFMRNDGVLLRAMFAEENIPFFLDTDVNAGISSGMNQETKQLVHVQVHKDSKDKAVSLIEAHFNQADGVYAVKYSDIRERLKSFSFQEIQHAEIDIADIVDVSFSHEEKDVLLRYAARLIHDIDRIEAGGERIVFFFDNVEELTARLSDDNASLSKTDLLTALEILQIYCDEPDFPQTAHGIAEALLSFFTQ
jgi:hypothetical protein